MEVRNDTVVRSREAYHIVFREIREALIVHEDVFIDIINQYETA
jgi:hypothetical protein